ncbi:MAG: hypothetical protein GY832_02485 [Chloroflexi bacterium]|nr:hypothetical protein [Chloroflexota bacterium]
MGQTVVELIGTIRVTVPVEHNGQVPDKSKLEAIARQAYQQTVENGGPADIYTESMELGEIRTVDENPLLLVNIVLRWPDATLNSDISVDRQHAVALRTGTLNFFGQGDDILSALADLERNIYDMMVYPEATREQIAHQLTKVSSATEDSRDAAL